MLSDKEYIESLSDALWDTPARVGVFEFKNLIVRTAAKLHDKRGRYAAAYPSIISFYHWFEGTPKYADSKDRQSEIVSEILNAIQPERKARAGLKKMVPLVGWLLHFRHQEAVEFFKHEDIAPTLAGAGVEVRSLKTLPRLFKTWDEYRDVRQDRSDKSSAPTKIEPEPRFWLPLDRPRPGGPSTYRTALDMRYTNQITRLQGRDHELSRLREFVETPKPLTWWQIAGEAGQGKSRLALHLINQYHGVTDQAGRVWEAGFLRNFSESTLTKLLSRPDDCNLLIVIDYIASSERSRAFAKLVDHFARQIASNAEDQPKTRILILERQPYRLDVEPSSTAVGWQEDVLHAHLGETAKRAVQTVYDQKSALILPDLHADKLMEIARDWIRELKGRELLSKETRYIYSALSIHPSEVNDAILPPLKKGTRRPRYRRPLFAIIAADAASRGDAKLKAIHFEFESILKSVLGGEARELGLVDRFGSGVCEDQLPAPQQDEWRKASHLAMLANIIGAVELDALALMNEESAEAAPPSPTSIYQANLVLGRRISKSGAHDEIAILGREPDLLAEFQVLDFFEASDKKKHLNKILEMAWKLAPDQTRAFTRRCAEDFPHHPTLIFILNETHISDPVSLINSGQANLIIRDLGRQNNIKAAELYYKKLYVDAIEGSDIFVKSKERSDGAINISYEFSRNYEFEKATKYYDEAIKLIKNIDNEGDKYLRWGRLVTNYTDYFANKFPYSSESIRRLVDYIDSKKSNISQNAYSSYRLWALNNLANKLFECGLCDKAHKLLQNEYNRIQHLPMRHTIEREHYDSGLRVTQCVEYILVDKVTINNVKFNFNHHLMRQEAAFLNSLLLKIHLKKNDAQRAKENIRILGNLCVMWPRETEIEKYYLNSMNYIFIRYLSNASKLDILIYALDILRFVASTTNNKRIRFRYATFSVALALIFNDDDAFIAVLRQIHLDTKRWFGKTILDDASAAQLECLVIDKNSSGGVKQLRKHLRDSGKYVRRYLRLPGILVWRALSLRIASLLAFWRARNELARLDEVVSQSQALVSKSG